MKYTCLILLWSLFATMALPADNLIQSISIVPCPESITPGTGYFTFSGKTDFTVENEEQAEVARCFSALFTQAAGFTPCVKVGEKKGKISFLTDDALKSEAYHLEITPRQIIVKASDTKGFFYALQTIRQLLPASIEGTAVAETADWSVPAMTIKDEPRFGYRGLMVDVARFFIPKENLLRIIDCMGMLKINTLHLHLVDDNGWRIEIKRYPLLPGPIYNKNGQITFISNRVLAHHIGFCGSPCQSLSYRMLLSYSRHWGTYDNPLNEIKKQFNSLFEVTYAPQQLKGWSFTVSGAMDRGNILGNNYGGMLVIRKQGIIKSGNK